MIKPKILEKHKNKIIKFHVVIFAAFSTAIEM